MAGFSKTATKEDSRETKLNLLTALTEKARRSFRNYCVFIDKNYQTPDHLDKVLIPALQSVADDKIDRLMVFMPPRHGKSETASRMFPSYYLGRKPDTEIVLTSYSYNLAKGFSRCIRDIIDSVRYKMLFQTKLRKDQQSLDHWAIEKAKGGLLASGVGGSITGEGADLFIIDDPFKGMKEAESKLQRDRVWEWYQSVVLTRLHPGAKLIIVLTRWHRDDLAGRILADPEEAKDWKVINLAALIEDENQQKADPLNRKIGQALWPMRYAASLLEKMRKRVGSRVWQSLYQGNPQDADSAKFKRFWFENNWYEKIPERFSSFCGIDTATSMKSKADNFAFVTVLRCAKTNNLYVHDAVCGKMSVTAFAKTVCRLDSVYNYTGGHLENNNAGEAIRQRIHEIGEELKKIPMIEARQTSTDKMVRAMEWQHLVENNTLKWNMSNPGVKELVEHILAFDGNDSDIDDDVDALGFAIAAATEGLHQAFYGLTPDDSYDPLAGSQ